MGTFGRHRFRKSIVKSSALGDQNKELLDQVPITGVDPLEPGPTIFCGVYTMERNHPTNVRAMRETWAPHCDGFVANSTRSDPRIPALGIEHEGREEYDNMWQKSRSIWQFIGKHYLLDFDYFILGGEDLLVIPGNLRRYLKSLSVSSDDDLFAGRRFKGRGKDNYFNSGGAGYVLSRGTLRKFYDKGLDNPACHAHEHTPMEDVMIADCLRKAFNIGLTDTRDSIGRERFHPFAPGTHLTWRPPLPGKTDWYADYNEEWGVKLGPQCCAPDSVSFHYIKKPSMVRHLFSLLYFCANSKS
jgi:glycoprotein-N-acetylgalactosamine 3-beta-galactosyltransferase